MKGNTKYGSNPFKGKPIPKENRMLQFSATKQSKGGPKRKTRNDI